MFLTHTGGARVGAAIAISKSDKTLVSRSTTDVPLSHSIRNIAIPYFSPCADHVTIARLESSPLNFQTETVIGPF